MTRATDYFCHNFTEQQQQQYRSVVSGEKQASQQGNNQIINATIPVPERNANFEDVPLHSASAFAAAALTAGGYDNYNHNNMVSSSSSLPASNVWSAKNTNDNNDGITTNNNVSSLEYLLALKEQALAANNQNHRQHQQHYDHPQHASSNGTDHQFSTRLPWEATSLTNGANKNVNASTFAGVDGGNGFTSKPETSVMSSSYNDNAMLLERGERERNINQNLMTNSNSENAIDPNMLSAVMFLNQQQQRLSSNSTTTTTNIKNTNGHNDAKGWKSQSQSLLLASSSSKQDNGPQKSFKQGGFPFCRFDNKAVSNNNNNFTTRPMTYSLQSFRQLWNRLSSAEQRKYHHDDYQDFVKRDFIHRISSCKPPIVKDTSVSHLYNTSKERTRTSTVTAAATNTTSPLVVSSSNSQNLTIGTTSNRFDEAIQKQRHHVQHFLSLSSTSSLQGGNGGGCDITSGSRKKQRVVKMDCQPQQHYGHHDQCVENNKLDKSNTSAAISTTTKTTNNDRKEDDDDDDDTSYANYILKQARWMHAI